MAKNEQTSAKAASAASKVLRDPKASAAAKSAAGSAPTSGSGEVNGIANRVLAWEKVLRCLARAIGPLLLELSMTHHRHLVSLTQVEQAKMGWRRVFHLSTIK